MTELPLATLVPGAGLALSTVPWVTLLGTLVTVRSSPAACSSDSALLSEVLVMPVGTVTFSAGGDGQRHGVALLDQGVGRRDRWRSPCRGRRWRPVAVCLTTSPSCRELGGGLGHRLAGDRRAG